MHLYTPCVVQHVAFDMILITRYVSKWMVQMFMFWIYLKYICDRTRYCNLPCVLFYRKEQYYPHFVKYFPQFSSVQLLSCVQLFATPWTAACQASLSITNSRSSLKLRSIELETPSSHLILCRPLLLLPPIPPSIRVFSNESALRMRLPKYWSFSFSIIP